MVKSSTVLVTRPAAQAQSLLHMLVQADIPAIAFPSLDIQALSQQAPIFQALSALCKTDIIIFTSTNAVHHTMSLWPSIWPSRKEGARVFSMGPATSTALAHYGIDSETSNEAANSEALLALPALSTVVDKKVILFSGMGGRETLEDELNTRGARVQKVATYRRAKPCQDASKLREHWDAISTFISTSGESLENLVAMLTPVFSESVFDKGLVVVSENMVKLAQTLKFRARIICADNASDAAILRALKSEEN